MAQIYGLSEEANRQLREMFRDFYSQYIAPIAQRKRWHHSGVPQILIGKTDAACTAPDTVTVSIWAGDDDDLADTTDNVTAFSLAYDLDSGIFVKLTPYSAISGIVGESGASYLVEPLGCNA